MPPCSAATTTVDYDKSTEQASMKVDRHKVVEVSSPTREGDRVLKGLYIVTSYLCCAMFFWIMVLPASWLIGRSALHREVILPFLEERDFFWLVPKPIVAKYADHALVHFTHILPGAAWVAVIPFQFHPTWRKKNARLHRLFGYLFIAASLAIASGVFVILERDLTYDHFFHDLPPTDNTGKKRCVSAFTLWFAGTGIQAVRMARARQFSLHQKWMLRHVAAGIWVAAQRMIIIPICIIFTKTVTHRPPMKPSQWLQREIFGGSALVALVSCVCLGEYAYKRICKLKPQPISMKGASDKDATLRDDLSREAASAHSVLKPTKDPVDVAADLHEHKESRTAFSEKDDPVLARLYFFVSALCFAMVLWILIAPASWLIERSRFHREILIPFFEANGVFRIIPKHSITKYDSHSLVHVTHILPAAIWSAIIPFQLHPTWRNHHRKLHRRMGYLFAMVSLVMAFGVYVIVQRNLGYEQYFPDVPVTERCFSAQIFAPAVVLAATWFVVTLVRSVCMARARKNQLHQKWMVRHVASGVWVIAQRYLVAHLYIAYADIIWPSPEEVPIGFQIRAFTDSGLVTLVLSLCLGEFTVRRMAFVRSQERERKIV